MRFRERAFSGESDFAAMLDLATLSLHDNLHSVDLPYRFSSWAFGDPSNVALWMDSRGRLAAWTFFDRAAEPHRSYPFLKTIF